MAAERGRRSRQSAEDIQGSGTALSDPEGWAQVLRPLSKPIKRPTPRVTLVSAVDFGPVTGQYWLVRFDTHTPPECDINSRGSCVGGFSELSAQFFCEPKTIEKKSLVIF